GYVPTMLVGRVKAPRRRLSTKSAAFRQVREVALAGDFSLPPMAFPTGNGFASELFLWYSCASAENLADAASQMMQRQRRR
ncbi:hypothetical protein ABTL44_19770, partial [Acinetobacter baumannii]